MSNRDRLRKFTKNDQRGTCPRREHLPDFNHSPTVSEALLERLMKKRVPGEASIISKVQTLLFPEVRFAD